MGGFIPNENFSLIGDITIAGEGMEMFTYARHSWPMSNEESLTCHTFCDIREDCIIVRTVIHSIKIKKCITCIYILLSFLLDNSRVVKTYVCLLSKEIESFCMFLYILNFFRTNLLLFFIYFLFTHTNRTHSVLKWIY